MLARRTPQGAALPVVVFAMALVAILAAGFLWAGHVESRAASAVARAHAVRLAADGFWPALLTGADSLGLPLLVPGDSAVIAGRAVAGGRMAGAAVHRLGSELFLVESWAWDVAIPAISYQVQVLARLDQSGGLPVLRPLESPFWSSLPSAR